MKTMTDLGDLRKNAINEIKNSTGMEELDEVRVKYLGREGKLTEVLRSLSDLPLEKKREIGPVANSLKDELLEIIKEKKEEFEERLKEKKKAQIDLTKPGEEVRSGRFHPLTLVGRKVKKIFSSLNFEVVDGPHVEFEYYNFDALNIPPDHPARDMWDTFWLNGEPDEEMGRQLLRTHTSPMQIRYMEKNNPPLRIVVPGRVFRYEATDASHEINFYQLEGLMVGKDVTLANFKYLMEEFLQRFFEKDIEFRFRPGYFPFTEPSLEVDIRFGESQEWLEVLGAGMVHRNVLDAVGYVPDDWQGFAFGVGLDRLAMIKYDIPDIRLFYSGDLRFIRQF